MENPLCTLGLPYFTNNGPAVSARGGGGGDLVSSMPGCVCRKVKEMGPFSASRDRNEWEFLIQNGCEICGFTDMGENFLDIMYEVM